MTVYVIKHKTRPGVYWKSGFEGWTDAKNASEFEDHYLTWCPLPPDGEWVALTQPTIPRKEAS